MRKKKKKTRKTSWPPTSRTLLLSHVTRARREPTAVRKGKEKWAFRQNVNLTTISGSFNLRISVLMKVLQSFVLRNRISSPEPKGRWPWKLVCSIGCSSTTKFVQMMTLSWPWPILWQGQIWSLMLFWGCLPLTCGYIHLLNHEKGASLFIIINVWK